MSLVILCVFDVHLGSFGICPSLCSQSQACCFKVLQSCTNIQSAQQLKQEGEDKLSRAYLVTPGFGEEL